MSFCRSRVPRSTTLRELHGDIGCGVTKWTESKSPLPGPGSYNPRVGFTRSRSCGAITTKSVRDTSDWLVRRSFGSGSASGNPPLYNVRESKSQERKSFNYATRLAAPSSLLATKYSFLPGRASPHKNGMMINGKFYVNRTERDLSASKNCSNFASPSRRKNVSPSARKGSKKEIEEEVLYSPISHGKRPYPAKLAQMAQRQQILTLDRQQIMDHLVNEERQEGEGQEGEGQEYEREGRSPKSPKRAESQQGSPKSLKGEGAELPRSPNMAKVFKPTYDRFIQNPTLLNDDESSLGTSKKNILDASTKNTGTSILDGSKKGTKGNGSTKGNGTTSRTANTTKGSKGGNNTKMVLPIKGTRAMPISRSRSYHSFVPKSRVQTYYQKDNGPTVSGHQVAKNHRVTVGNLKDLDFKDLNVVQNEQEVNNRVVDEQNRVDSARRSPSPNSFGQSMTTHRPNLFLKSHGAYGKRGETHCGIANHDALNYRGNYKLSRTYSETSSTNKGKGSSTNKGKGSSINSKESQLRSQGQNDGGSSSAGQNNKFREYVPDSDVQHRKKLQETIISQIAANREKLERRTRLLQQKRAEIRGQVYGDFMEQFERSQARSLPGAGGTPSSRRVMVAEGRFGDEELLVSFTDHEERPASVLKATTPKKPTTPNTPSKAGKNLATKAGKNLKSTSILNKTRGATKLLDHVIAIQNRSNAFVAKSITESGVRY